MANDWLKPYLAQRQNAATNYGRTSIRDVTTASGAPHPNVTGAFVVETAGYWLREANRIDSDAGLFGRPSSAFEALWNKSKQTMQAWIATGSDLAGKGLLPPSQAAAFWGDVKDFMLQFKGTAATPSTWTLVSEAVKSSLKTTGGYLKWIAIAAGALAAASVASSLRRR